MPLAFYTHEGSVVIFVQFCLGPIARPQLGTCLSRSKATARLSSSLIIACIVHTHTCTLVSSTAIKIPAEPNHAIDILFICTHGGSAESALPVARRIRLDSEKEKRNSPGIHLCSQLNHCP